MLEKKTKYNKNADFIPEENMNLGSFLSLGLLKVAQTFIISPDNISEKINVSVVLFLNNWDCLLREANGEHASNLKWFPEMTTLTYLLLN